jgi:hypothetical protein
MDQVLLSRAVGIEMDDEKAETDVETTEGRGEAAAVLVVDFFVGDTGYKLGRGITREDDNFMVARGNDGFEQVGCYVYGMSVSAKLRRRCMWGRGNVLPVPPATASLTILVLKPLN